VLTHLNKFEKGNTDVFTLEVKTEVGKMKAMEINHDSWGLGSSWFLEKVKIKNLDENEEQEFLIRQWLDKNSEKGNLIVQGTACIVIIQKIHLIQYYYLF